MAAIGACLELIRGSNAGLSDCHLFDYCTTNHGGRGGLKPARDFKPAFAGGVASSWGSGSEDRKPEPAPQTAPRRNHKGNRHCNAGME